MSWREYPHEDDVFETDDEVEEQKEALRYEQNMKRCKLILIQAFGAGNTILQEYFREVDHGGSCSWNDYQEMTPEEVEADFIMYRETRGHGTPNFD